MSGYDFMLRFATEHPFLTFCVILTVGCVLSAPFTLVSRWIRHKNIKERGWPPHHLDADGDPINDRGGK